MIEVRGLAQQGRPRDAIDLVTKSADAGDPEAAFVLANWRLWGIYGPRDLDACHVLLARAADSGWNEAARLRATLIANGTGCPSDFEAAQVILQQLEASDEEAARQLALLRSMPTPQEVGRLGVNELSAAPAIRMVRELFSPEECEYLIAKAKPALRPSLVVNPITRRHEPDPMRTSRSMNFDPSQEDPVVNRLNRRIASFTETPFECGEMLCILSYGQGEEYRPHIDALPAALNQRHMTALVYLNSDYSGGETSFTDLGLKVKGNTGDCLIFQNVTEDGRPDLRTRHAGLPVTEGTKWLASRWIRKKPYDPFKPA